jgi:hypothetical protein
MVFDPRQGYFEQGGTTPARSIRYWLEDAELGLGRDCQRAGRRASHAQAGSGSPRQALGQFWGSRESRRGHLPSADSSPQSVSSRAVAGRLDAAGYVAFIQPGDGIAAGRAAAAHAVRRTSVRPSTRCTPPTEGARRQANAVRVVSTTKAMTLAGFNRHYPSSVAGDIASQRPRRQRDDPADWSARRAGLTAATSAATTQQRCVAAPSGECGRPGDEPLKRTPPVPRGGAHHPLVRAPRRR